MNPFERIDQLTKEKRSMEIAALKLADDYDALKSDLASVTAERDAEFRRSDSELAAAAQKESALRAMAQARIDQLAARVAELEAALRKCQAFLNEWRDCLAGVQMTEADFDNTSGLLEARSAIARAESAPTPAKHPDTVRLDWLASNKQSGGKAFCLQWTFRDNNNQTNIRSAIDAAIAKATGGAA